MVSGLGVYVLDDGAVPAGSVSAWKSGARSASEAKTPGLCFVLVRCLLLWPVLLLAGLPYAVCG
jgi:hypothetical protein